MWQLIKSALKEDPKNITIITILSIINSLTKGVSVVMLIPLLDLIDISSSDIGVFNFAIELFAHISYNARVIILLLIYILIMVASSSVTRMLNIQNTIFVQKYVKNLRLIVYDSVLDSDWEVVSAQNYHNLVNSFTDEIRRISSAMTVFPKLISIIIMAITQVAIALLLNLPLTLIIISTGGLFFYAFRGYFTLARQIGERTRVANRSFLGEIREQLDSLQEIKSYGVESTHKELLHQILSEYEDANIVGSKAAATPNMLFTISSTMLIAIIFYVANVLFKVELIEMVLIIYIFARVWPIFSDLHRQIQIIYNAVPSFNNIQSTIIRLKSHIEEVKECDSEITFKNKVTFNQVAFSYHSSTDLILNNTSFTINANAITALKGKSGVGKSTIVNLIMGLLKPTSGEILIDDIPLSNSNLKSWRNRVGYMPQHPTILNKSILENLKRFNPTATEEDIIVALEKAKAKEFVDTLPDGLNTLMGNKGVRLSGGQKQRIALARALVSKPSVLILDEATSALDDENERYIQNTIQSLKSGVTIVIIAHRQSTIDAADYVINIQEGGLAETIAH